jgi:hypothetical protein
VSAGALVYEQRIKAILTHPFTAQGHNSVGQHNISRHIRTRMGFYFLSVISGFHCDVEDIGDPLGYQAVWSGDSVPTFRDNLSVHSSRVNNSSFGIV